LEENASATIQDLDIFRKKADESKLKLEELYSYLENKNNIGFTVEQNLTIIEKLNIIFEELTTKSNIIIDEDYLINNLTNEKD